MSDHSNSTQSGDDVPWYMIDVDSDLGNIGMTEQHKVQRNRKQTKKSIRNYRHATGKWGAALEGFGPLWFAIPLSTGGLAILLNAPFPYPATWQVTLATILYVFQVVTYIIFLGLMVTRWIMYPHVAVRRLLRDPDEMGAYAIPAITLMTLAALTATQVSNAGWAGYNWTLLSYAFWWIGMFWVYVTCVAIWSLLFYTGNQFDRVMTPVLFMAPIGLATAGAEAGLITVNGAFMNSSIAVPQLVVAYFCVGVAFFMAIILYTMFFHRLMAGGWPAPPKRVGLFMLIGASGQLSTAFQVLGESASQYMRFAQYKQSGTFWRPETAMGLETAGLLLGLLSIGFGYLIFCLALIGVIDILVRRQFSYSLVWWSLVFPSVTFTTAWIQLARSMDSPTFRGLSTAMTVLIALAYFFNLGFTLKGVADGSLVFKPSQIEMEEELGKKAQSVEKKEDA